LQKFTKSRDPGSAALHERLLNEVAATIKEERMSRMHLITRRAIILLSATCAFAMAVSPASAQQSYPDRPIRMIVPLSAASTVDIVARVMVDQMGPILGQNLIVDNKPGAGGVIGTEALVQSSKDGYTIGMTSSNHVINPYIIKSVPFDSIKDITPISIVATTPLVLVVHPSVAAHTAQEYIALAKEKPAEITYGSAGNGSVLHLAGVMLASQAGIDIEHVPYKGTGPLANDLLGGHINSGFLSVAAALPYIKAGTMRPIAVSTPQRAAALPDVPTFAESGLPNYNFDAWIALIGPAGLPKPIVDRLYEVSQTVLGSQKTKDAFAAQGISIVGSDPQTSAKFFVTELEKHKRLVEQAKVKAE
jgi:tripartite-type tricarboxylate transporter receptor subunit TctC